jgi:hypothetical protein
MKTLFQFLLFPLLFGNATSSVVKLTPIPVKMMPEKSGVVTFIANQDCYVGTKLNPGDSWGIFSLGKGKSYTKAVPAGRRLIYGTGLASTQEGMPLEIYQKGTVGGGEKIMVP